MSHFRHSHRSIITALFFALTILLEAYYITDRRTSTIVMFLLVAGWFAVDGCRLPKREPCRVRVRRRRDDAQQ